MIVVTIITKKKINLNTYWNIHIILTETVSLFIDKS